MDAAMDSSEIFELLTSKEAECNDVDAITYDDRSEHFGGTAVASDGIVCCRGAQSCEISTRIEANSVVCGGKWSCSNIDDYIQATDVICSGSRSCEKSQIAATNV